MPSELPRTTGFNAQMRAADIRLLCVTGGFVLLGGCFGDEHPNPSRYEYLYIDGAFQPPHKTFPAGADRLDWKCYDDRSRREFDCTFVRGGWEYYRYIYRARS
jgi:hypothetical protein